MMEALTNKHIKQHISAVKGFATSFVGDDNAEDIMQEVFIKALLHVHQIEEKSLRAWLLVSTRSTSLDFIRNERRKKQYENLGWRYLHSAPSDAIKNVLLEQLFSMSIPELWKQIVWLYSYEELSMVEIARQLGISYNSAWRKYRKGLREFRAKLED